MKGVVKSKHFQKSNSNQVLLSDLYPRLRYHQEEEISRSGALHVAHPVQAIQLLRGDRNHLRQLFIHGSFSPQIFHSLTMLVAN